MVVQYVDVITISPGLIGASKTPRKNRPAAKPLKLVAAPEAARVAPLIVLINRLKRSNGDHQASRSYIPHKVTLTVKNFPVGNFCMR